ncbi:MAG TPA: galactose-1-phosphate uridylyltransferase [Polyangiaceae bacterium]|nr:galactose-1-phosphate uridylyltransferase [Polyangiaceae bacterium]
MSTLRFDVTSGDWVAFSDLRAKRPHTFQKRTPESLAPPHFEPNCPFCPGNEGQTPEATDLELDPEQPSRWSVRVCANKYPVLDPTASTNRRLIGPLFREMDGHGRHELLVESPDHGCSLANQPLAQVERVIRVLHRRALALSSDASLEVVQIFKNHGSFAGSSMPHPHFQIISTPVVPRQVRIKYQMAAEYYNTTGTSVYSELCRAELEAGVRVVSANDEFVAFAPFASRTPYETWIVPRRASSTFENAAPETLAALPATLSDVLKRISRTLDDPPYNLVIHSAPRRHADEPDFVWHIEILPRLATAAGFELATGMAINTVLPELAAEALRAHG